MGPSNVGRLKREAGWTRSTCGRTRAASRKCAWTRWCASTKRSSRGISGGWSATPRWRSTYRRTFSAAYRILKADPTRELTAGWLYRAATNAAISFMRRRKDRANVAARLGRRPRAVADRRTQCGLGGFASGVAQTSGGTIGGRTADQLRGLLVARGCGNLRNDLGRDTATGVPGDANATNGDDGKSEDFMMANDCARAEITAGAAALGEASDAERDAIAATWRVAADALKTSEASARSSARCSWSRRRATRKVGSPTCGWHCASARVGPGLRGVSVWPPSQRPRSCRSASARGRLRR